MLKVSDIMTEEALRTDGNTLKINWLEVVNVLCVMLMNRHQRGFLPDIHADEHPSDLKRGPE